MIKVGDGKRERLARRIRAEFAAVLDDLVDIDRAIIASMSSTGSPKTGATTRKMMAAASTQAEVATKSALEAFERACTHPLVSRGDLKSLVKTEVRAGVEQLHKYTAERLASLGFDQRDISHAAPLSARTEAKILAAVDAHFEGWTGPALSWAKRHPGWMAVGSFGAGILAGDFFQIVGWLAKLFSR